LYTNTKIVNFARCILFSDVMAQKLSSRTRSHIILLVDNHWRSAKTWHHLYMFICKLDIFPLICAAEKVLKASTDIITNYYSDNVCLDLQNCSYSICIKIWSSIVCAQYLVSIMMSRKNKLFKNLPHILQLSYNTV
jgi:hypothetical protein